MRVKFMLFSIERANRINRRFLWIGEKLSDLFYSLKYDLHLAGIKIDPEKYLTAAFFSALTYFAIFFALFSALFFARSQQLDGSLFLNALFFGLIFGFVFFLLHVFYPRIIAKNLARTIDNNLLFAVKSMYVQVCSGISLYNTLVYVAKSGYVGVSEEFEYVVKEINSGESEAKALEKMAIKTSSEHLKKTCWQLLSAIRSGASVKGALQSIVAMLVKEQERAIRDYSSELNVWVLMYMLFAAAIPSLGLTFIVILSSLAGASIGQHTIVFIIMVSFAIQLSIIGFVKSRIPKVFLT
ncbi:MAG: type II secretion system F family protein [Candidatus Diapherotrites archaeon]|nr:type II secretion system F family protein [Candidatus Diapherotrites archaeon]